MINLLRFEAGQSAVEQLWRQFFSDPSGWWDHRLDKVNSKYPDFKHKKTGVALWINGKLSPLWVKTEAAAMPPGSVQRSPFAWNTTLAKYVKSGQSQLALDLFRQMQAEGSEPDSFTFVTVANACANLGDMEECRSLHAEVAKSNCESDAYVGSSLVNMYAKCGCMDDAWKLFTKIPIREVVAWTAMLEGYVKAKQGIKALELFRHMLIEGVKPNGVTFATVLNACASLGALEEGKWVHAQVIHSGFESDALVATSLIDMYAKCGNIEDAQRVFNKMPTHNVVSWTAMLVGYVKCEQGQKALDLYQQLQAEGIKPDTVTFTAVINACASVAALDEGMQVHAQVTQSGCEGNVCIASSLVNMYAKCGKIQAARRVFNKMHTRNVVSWTAMIMGYVNSDQGQKALKLYWRMQLEGVNPNNVTFVMVLNACASLSALEEGRRAHAHIIASGCESDVFVASSLVDMYAKCGSLKDAKLVFYKMPMRNVVSYTAMLGGLAMHGHGREAIKFFEDMFRDRVDMNNVTLVCLLSACSHAGLVDEGLHYFKSMSSVYGISPTPENYVCVIDLLGRAGRLDEAQDIMQAMSLDPSCNRKKFIVTALKVLLAACRNNYNFEIGENVAKRLRELD